MVTIGPKLPKERVQEVMSRSLRDYESSLRVILKRETVSEQTLNKLLK
jgi:hypothetical protein